MKNILVGTGIGAATGIFADKIINKDNQHSYVKSALAGAVMGGVAGKLFAHSSEEVLSAAGTSIKNTEAPKTAPAPAPAPTPAPTATAATPVQSMPKAPVTSPVQQSTPSAAVSAKPAPAATPQSTEAPKSPILKLNKIKETAGTISSEISNASGKILTSLKAQASSVRTGISRAAYGMANSIATGASKAKGVGYDLLSNLKYSASGIAKSLVATAREAKIPTVNLQLAKLKSPSIDLSLPQTNKRIALLAAAFGIAPQTLHNPQAPMQIVHAQQTMSTSSFGASAHDMVSQALDDVIHAIPRMMEHPRQTIQKAYNASAVKPAIEASAAGNSFGMSNYSDELARRMVINKTNNGQPFIVADPKYGTLSTYDARGIKTGTHNALFGKNQLSGNDAINPFENPEVNTSLANAMSRNVDAGYDWLDRNNLRRIHPGIYQYRKVLLDYSSKYGKFGLQDTNIVGKSNNSSGLGFAIHNTYLGTPLERRAMRLKSKTVDDNFISYGCVNVDPKQLQKVILPKLGERVQVAMASADQSMRGKYLGLSDSPMFDNNKAALELVQNLKPSSNFIIAAKKR